MLAGDETNFDWNGAAFVRSHQQRMLGFADAKALLPCKCGNGEVIAIAIARARIQAVDLDQDGIVLRQFIHMRPGFVAEGHKNSANFLGLARHERHGFIGQFDDGEWFDEKCFAGV